MLLKHIVNVLDFLVTLPPWAFILILVGGTAFLFSLKKYFWILQYRKKQILLTSCAIIFALASWFSWNNQHPIYSLAMWYYNLACAHPFLPEAYHAMTIFYGCLFFFALYISVYVDYDVLAVILDGKRWTLRAFNRGWIITGQTGKGKTEGPVMQIMFQLTKNLPNWGGVVIDWKRDLCDKVEAVFKHFKLEHKLRILRVDPEERLAQGNERTEGKERFNLLGYPLPHATYAKLILDVATSLGQKDNKAFFSNQAQIHIAKSIEVLHYLRDQNENNSMIETKNVLNRILSGEIVDVEEDSGIDPESANKMLDFSNKFKTVSLKNLYKMNTSIEIITTMKDLIKIHISDRFGKHECLPEAYKLQGEEIVQHFEDYITQPKDQRGGIISSIQNYLYFFQEKQFADVFCSDLQDTVCMQDIDNGTILAIDMPKYYDVQRAYIGTFLKFLFFKHAQIRYDKGSKFIAKSNNIVLIVDEAQDVITDCPGLSDRQAAAQIRGANATMIFAMQSYLSAVPVIGEKNTDVLMLNLTNKIHLCEGNNESAEKIAKQLGQMKMIVRSHGVSGFKHTYNDHESREYLIEPYTIMSLKKFECIIAHCDHGWKLGKIKPIEPNGRTAKWYHACMAEEAANYKPQERIAA